MLEILFGGKNIERVLFYLLKQQKAYASKLCKIFGCSLSPLQKAFDRLESGGIVVSFLEGKTRIYQFNPRYPFLKELKGLLEKAYTFLPEDFKRNYYEIKERKRPRKRGKPL